jgi:hypothetical protein
LPKERIQQIETATVSKSPKRKSPKKKKYKSEKFPWLEYDSPYAEYLVARYKEWSPENLKMVRFFPFIVFSRYFKDNLRIYLEMNLKFKNYL